MTLEDLSGTLSALSHLLRAAERRERERGSSGTTWRVVSVHHSMRIGLRKCWPETLSIGPGAMRLGNQPGVCLDTSVFIFFLTGNDLYSALCRDVLQEAQSALFFAITSTLAIVDSIGS